MFFIFVHKQFISCFLFIQNLGLADVLLVGLGDGSYRVVLFGDFSLRKPYFSDLIREQVWFNKNLSQASLTQISVATVNCQNIWLRNLY